MRASGIGVMGAAPGNAKLWHALIGLRKPAFNPPRDWEPRRKNGLIDL